MSGSRSGRGRASPGLIRAQQRLERWRRNGGGQGRRIPDELWQEAANVARAEGLYSTSRALGVDYGRLKKHVASAEVAASKPAAGGQAAAPAFMELDLGQLQGARAVVELTGRDGCGMRVEIVGAAVVDVMALVQTFWCRQS